MEPLQKVELPATQGCATIFYLRKRLKNEDKHKIAVVFILLC